MVGGSEHHPVYANPRQHPQKEESILRHRAFHLRTGTQSATSVPQARFSTMEGELIGIAPSTTLELANVVVRAALKAQCTSAPFRSLEHPPAGTRPATRPGVSQHTRVCHGTTAEEESRSPVRGTEEPDRTTSPAPAEIEICAGAILPGSGGAEHQAFGAIPQPTDNAGPAGHRVAWGVRKRESGTLTQKFALLSEFFNTHRRLHQLLRQARSRTGS